MKPTNRSGNIPAIVILLLCIFFVTGCSSSEKENTGSSTLSDKSTVSETSIISESSVTSESSIVPASSAASEASVTSQTADASFEEIPILESDDFDIKITDIPSADVDEYSWKLSIDNKTDKNITVSFENLSIDGIMNEPAWYQEVSAQTTADSTVEWYGLSSWGITNPSIFEGTLLIYDTDETWTEYYNDSFKVTPLGEDQVQIVSREPQDTDEVLLDNGYITITKISYTASEDMAEILLYIEAKSSNPVMASIDACSIGDTECDPYWACEVLGNKTAYSAIIWDSTMLEASQLTVDDIKDVTLKMNVYNSETFDNYANENITVTVK